MRDAGRLGALLVQFPQSVHLLPENLARIERLRELTTGWPLVVEVRHRSWHADEAEAWFAEREIGWCFVDQPQVGDSTLGALPRVTAPVAYLRLHGRNAANWFRPDAGRDARYDYLYSVEQMRQVGAAAQEMAGRSRVLYAIQNNHFRGQALVNALQLKHIVEETLPPAPEEQVRAYPDLEPFVSVERRHLF